MKSFPLLAAAACAAFALWSAAGLRADPLLEAPVKDIDGQPAHLESYKGQVLLIVNVASKCGFTPQYAALESDFEKFKDQGLVVLGFPCNQFKSQEPGTAAEIKDFCTSKFHVSFPMFDKIEVNGPDRNPLYIDLAGTSSPFPGDIKWNFTKFLIGRDGKILARFEPAVKPDSPEVLAAIQAALAVK